MEEALAVTAECERALEAPNVGWNSTSMFNLARKVTKVVRLMGGATMPATSIAQRVLIARGSLLSRLVRIQRTETSTAAYLNQCRENYALLEQRGVAAEHLTHEGASVQAGLDYASFAEASASFLNEPLLCQRGIVVLQVRPARRPGAKGAGWLHVGRGGVGWGRGSGSRLPPQHTHTHSSSVSDCHCGEGATRACVHIHRGDDTLRA